MKGGGIGGHGGEGKRGGGKGRLDKECKGGDEGERVEIAGGEFSYGGSPFSW